GVLVAGVVTVAQRVRLLRAGARDGVVVAHLVGDHGHQGGAVVGEQHAAGGQEDVALGGDGGLGAVAVGVVGGVVEQAVDRLIAVQVDDLELVARPDHGRPRRAGGHGLVEDDGAGHGAHAWISFVPVAMWCAAAAQASSVLWTARRYSGSGLCSAARSAGARQATRSRSVTGRSSSGCSAAATSSVTGRCTIRSTVAPAPAPPVATSPPSASTRTPRKNDTLGATSRGSRPCLAAASRSARRARGLGPHSASWWPDRSAITVASTRPWSDSSGWPVPR